MSYRKGSKQSLAVLMTGEGYTARLSRKKKQSDQEKSDEST